MKIQISSNLIKDLDCGQWEYFDKFNLLLLKVVLKSFTALVKMPCYLKTAGVEQTKLKFGTRGSYNIIWVVFDLLVYNNME